MDNKKTVITQTPNQMVNKNQQGSKSNKLPLILLVLAIVIIAGGLLYYFLVLNSDPKFKIAYLTDDGLEQKSQGDYELLYKSDANLNIEIELSKQPKSKEYFIEINGEKEKIEPEVKDGKLVFIKKIKPNEFANTDFSVNLSDNNDKTLYSDKIKITVVRPNMSSREYVENYLRTYSDAFSSQSSGRLFDATSYWTKGTPDPLYSKLSSGFPKNAGFWYDNVISLPSDDVSAKVYVYKYNDRGSTSFTYSYLFKLSAVKENGLISWKIKSCDERLEKKDVFNYGDFGEYGD